MIHEFFLLPGVFTLKHRSPKIIFSISNQPRLAL